jgi:hypothetical protein
MEAVRTRAASETLEAARPGRPAAPRSFVLHARAVLALAACVVLMGACQAGLVGSILLAVPGTAH